MEKAFIFKWIELIRPLFPSNASIEIDEGDDLVLRIDWELRNDLDRPHKRSRLIRVVISREAIEDCKDFNVAGKRFRKAIEERLSLFNPEHNRPRYVGSPIEEWRVTTSVINKN